MIAENCASMKTAMLSVTRSALGKWLSSMWMSAKLALATSKASERCSDRMVPEFGSDRSLSCFVRTQSKAREPRLTAKKSISTGLHERKRYQARAAQNIPDPRLNAVVRQFAVQTNVMPSVGRLLELKMEPRHTAKPAMLAIQKLAPGTAVAFHKRAK